jgi:hypothetical protein
MVWKGFLFQHCTSLLPSLSGLLLRLQFLDYLYLSSFLQPGRVTEKAAGSISIMAAWVLLGRPHVMQGVSIVQFSL